MKCFLAPLLLMIGMLSGCSAEVVLTDVSDSPKNRPLIGTRYAVVGNVDAYGIRQHPHGEVKYITLVPPPGFTGWERGFKVQLEYGSIVTIAKVMRTNRWLDSRDAFIVTVAGTQMPVDVETRLELFRDNEGGGRLQLNPTIYRKIER
jgi:hypothetical protein